MTITISQVTNTQSFGTWLQRTNDIVTILGANVVTADSTAAGSVTTGNTYVNGYFGANNLNINTSLGGGTINNPNTLYMSTNLVVTNSTAFFGNSSSSVQLGYLSAASSLQENFGNQNNFIQNILLNSNNGTSASGDYVVYDNNSAGINSNNFIDFGINSSNWSNTQWTVNGPSDGYIYTGNTNLSIGTAGQKYINFFANGTFATNEVMRITSGANVGIGNTNPNAKLQVTGTANISGNVVFGGTLQIANTINVTGNSVFSNTINVTGNAVFSNTVTATGLVTVNNFNSTVANSVNVNVSNSLSVASVFVANSTVVNSASFAVGTISTSNGFLANSSLITLGNNSVNTFITANSITTNTVNTYVLNVTGLFIASNSALGSIFPPVGFSNTYAIGNSSLYFSNSYVYSTFTNSVSSFSGLLTLTSNTNINGIANVSGNTTIGGSANVSGNVVLGGVISLANINTMYSNNFNFSSTAQITVDSFSTSVFRSAEYLIELTDTNTSSYQLTKILLIHDGSSAYITEFGTIVNNSSLCSFVADVNGGNARLRGTPATSTVVAKFTRNTMVV